jgi:hypothetical protein
MFIDKKISDYRCYFFSMNENFIKRSVIYIVQFDPNLFINFMQSHAGLFNLCIVVLVAVNSRLIIENLMKVCVPPSLGNFS